jgi:hypothetical protein
MQEQMTIVLNCKIKLHSIHQKVYKNQRLGKQALHEILSQQKVYLSPWTKKRSVTFKNYLTKKRQQKSSRLCQQQAIT